jgi:electron transfer flavoprotein beta subunit
MLNIVVCVKAVPDPKEACNIKIDPDTKSLLRCDVPLVVNPLDKNAMEAALQLKEKFDAHITVLSMAPSSGVPMPLPRPLRWLKGLKRSAHMM